MAQEGWVRISPYHQDGFGGLSRLGERELATAQLPIYKTLVGAFRAMAHQ